MTESSEGPSPAVPPEGAAAGERPRLTTPTVLAGLAAVLLAAAVIGVLVTGSSATHVEGTASPIGPTASSVDSTGAVTSPTADQGAVGAPGDTTASRADGLVATFEATRRGLEPVPGLGAWETVAGTWGQAGGRAVLTAPGGVRSLAVVAPKEPPTAVGVSLSNVVVNAGLVVHFRDASHYMMLLAVPEQRALWLARVDGDPAQPGLVAVASGVVLRPATRIGLRMQAGSISLVLNDATVKVVDDPLAGVASGVGLVAGGEGADAPTEFDDFTVTLA